ncbi:MAG: MOSC domain-containing protein [Terriglobia bacterium]
MAEAKQEAMGRLISVNVGLPRTVTWHGKPVTSGIFKEPVAGRIRMRRLNLDGDKQADLTVHGGPDMAVYVYPSEHYAYWQQQLAGAKLPWGMFGENLSTEGLREESVNIGDTFRVGTAEVRVTQPRMPCYKLGMKFSRDDMPKLFLASRRTGFYFHVLREGEVGAGDEIELLGRDPSNVTVGDITRIYARDRVTRERVERAIALEALPAGWRDYFRTKLEAGAYEGARAKS